jgi:hypothetical protein
MSEVHMTCATSGGDWHQLLWRQRVADVRTQRVLLPAADVQHLSVWGLHMPRVGRQQQTVSSTGQ